METHASLMVVSLARAVPTLEVRIVAEKKCRYFCLHEQVYFLLLN